MCVCKMVYHHFYSWHISIFILVVYTNHGNIFYKNDFLIEVTVFVKIFLFFNIYSFTVQLASCFA